MRSPCGARLLALLAICAVCSGQTIAKRPTTGINTTKAASRGTTGTFVTAGLPSNSSRITAKVTPTTSPTRKGPTTDSMMTSKGAPRGSAGRKALQDNDYVMQGHNASLAGHDGHNLTAASHDPALQAHELNQTAHDMATTANDGISSVRHEEHEDSNTTESLDRPRYVSAKRGAVPYIVSIQFAVDESPEHRCSGIVVHSQWILTAARCATFARDGCGAVTVVSRSTGQDNAIGRVTKVVLHDPSSDSSGLLGPYSVALLKLETPLEFSDNLKSIPIAPPGSSLDGPLTLASWGRVDAGEPHSTRFKPVKSEVCRDIGPQPQAPVDVICATPVSQGPGRCYYDIGGPLVSEAGDRPQLVGMLTTWYLPCDTRKPALFLRMPEFAAWVLATTGKDIVTPPTTAWPSWTSPQSFGSTMPWWSLPTQQPSTPVARRPMTVSSALAPGKNSISNSGSSDTVDSSRAFSTATSSVEPGHSAQSETVSVGSAICQRDVGALSLTYSLSYANVTAGSSISSSNVNSSCADGVNTVQSLGWSVSSSDATPFDVKAVVQMHLDAISGLLRQPALLYL